jgi:hypothetical protein
MVVEAMVGLGPGDKRLDRGSWAIPVSAAGVTRGEICANQGRYDERAVRDGFWQAGGSGLARNDLSFHGRRSQRKLLVVRGRQSHDCLL